MKTTSPNDDRKFNDWENFRWVLGYLPEIDRLSNVAKELGLPRRISAVLLDGDIPRSQLYWDLLEAFVANLDADHFTFEFETFTFEQRRFKTDAIRHSHQFTSVTSMRDYVNSDPELGIPFNHAIFYLGSKPQAFIEVEPYATWGGPFPYHDSWTFAIYHAMDDTTQLRDACNLVCKQHGLPVKEVVHGGPEPVETPRWKRLLRWLLP